MIFYEPGKGHTLAHDPFNSIIAPRPIGWISTRSETGVLNLAPYSFFNAFNYTPPIVGFSSVGRKDSLTNAEATGEFVWNLVTEPLAEAMNQTSAAVAADIDEFQLAGLTPAPSRLLQVPRVLESPVAFECRVSQIVPLRSAAQELTPSSVVFGEVVGIHIAEDLVVNGIYDTSRARHIVRGGGPGDYFRIGPEQLFQLFRPT
jgi:flavin reductase (DIM6/NTAB) family NADH-FMN oxidoreductase RutF